MVNLYANTAFVSIAETQFAFQTQVTSIAVFQTNYSHGCVSALSCGAKRTLIECNHDWAAKLTTSQNNSSTHTDAITVGTVMSTGGSMAYHGVHFVEFVLVLRRHTCFKYCHGKILIDPYN